MILILIISILIGYTLDKCIYRVCQDLKKSNLNSFIIYTSTALSLSLIYFKYGVNLESLRYMALIPFIIVISIIDYHTKDIYNITVNVGILIQAIILILSMINGSIIYDQLAGLCIGTLIPYIISKTTKALGKGDIGVYSLCCFALGGKYIIYIIWISFLLCFPYAMYILLSKHDRIREIAFAPYISLATITVILINYDILRIFIL